ncbi:Type II restriction enzyme, methylase subunit (plasmid) [Halanaeroarchaeum sp. HSR-CO]|uniref:BREX-1 system adenine-specific DNA-methyltransferase PglX n=1 Tax=Halanaeroarchaeum sp. HSR-CO TaxID=2866382 RepID=UPI00217CCFBA|nr:BREX-1 system adenine-specific DNA-methyltransferase PglX [Halanaeroarchaeum sp. HSR-CO]UWG49143.1 Type II restriction enzyme, methylase subunit [Halanaeroarchaeum sp. HSR-CO]
MSATGTQTEFDVSEFDTSVSTEATDAVVRTIDESIARIREQVDDKILDELFEMDPGRYTMRSDFTRDQLDPEPFTKSRVIEPLLQTLGYEDYGYEAGSFAAERGEQADYAISLRDIDSVDSSRLLIEAEPINKVLQDRGHGLDQVKSWLSQREFESDFGFATDGIRWIFVRYDPDSYSHNIIESIDLRPVFSALYDNATGEHKPPEDVLTEDDIQLVSRLIRTFQYENFVAIIDDASEVIKRKQEDITDDFYDDYIRFVFGVADDPDERRSRSLIGDGIIPPEEADGDAVRLFAVDLMNRLIFIKFLEDKRIVRQDLLRLLRDTYEDGVYPQSLYKTFFDPLFYDVFNEKPESRDEQVSSLDVYSGIPYLNGGLFRPELNGGSGLSERTFDVRDTVLKSIIDLLEKYRFSTEGGPADIDPSVLGNVFEKTINYLTTDPGDQNADLGAYYTPKEITRFSAEETVRPALKERFETVLREERGWPEAEIQQYETLYELIDGLPGSGDLITALLSEMDDFYVVDPGMGSGHFLTSVIEEIVNVRQALYTQQETYPSRHRLKKTTVQNNIYGVDIMEPAVEIGKLRLWLSIISELREGDLEDLDVEEIALPNITFNVRQGNSLIGYVGFPEETADGVATFERWSEDSVRSRYEDVIEEIELYEETNAFPEKAERHRQKAKELLTTYREELDDEILAEFRDTVPEVSEGDLDEYTPFHWVLEFAEVYAEGGFDVIIGNPPWDRLRPTRDDFFARYDSEFMSLPPGEKDQRQEALLEDDTIADGWNGYQHEIEIVSQYFHEQYEMQTPTIGGTTQGTENDLSALFLERVFSLAKDGGYAAQVLPGAIFNGASTKDLRTHLLDETTVQKLVTFENRGIFPEIDTRYNFGVIAFKNEGRTEDLHGIFQQVGMDSLQDFDDVALTIPRRVLREYSPEARIFPYLQSQQEVEVLDTILAHPPISDDSQRRWYAEPYAELHRTSDTDRFVEEPSEGDYPVYGGSNVYQFSYDPSFVDIEPPEFWSVGEDVNPDASAKRRIREKNLRRLKRALYDEFDGSGSQIGFVNDLLEKHRSEELTGEDVLLDSTEYRIVFRDVARASDERTIIASVIPDGIVCTNTLHTIRPYEINPREELLSRSPLHPVYDRIFSDESLFLALGLLNSIPFDYLMRTKVDTHIVMYKFKESQVPNLTEGDDWFEYIWRRAARLNCYGDEFEEMRDRLGGLSPATDPDEREEIQAELDAAAFHAYGLGRQQTEFILDDFYQVQNPRRMTDEYLDLVLEKYVHLSET